MHRLDVCGKSINPCLHVLQLFILLGVVVAACHG
jgi:hypothetical protein